MTLKKTILYLFMVPLLLWFSGCATLVQKLPTASPQLTLDQEIALGQAVRLRTTQLLGGPYLDEELEAYLNRWGRKLGQVSARADLPYQFAVADRSEPGLFVLPAGQIVVTRGLLSELQSRDELIALLAHAIGHVDEDPFAGRATRSLAAASHEFLTSSPKGRQENPEALDVLLAKMLEKREYELDEELTADRIALELLAKAGLAKDGLAVMLSHCLDNHTLKMGLAENHPCSVGRLDALGLGSVAPVGDSTGQSLPASFGRLKSLQTGYGLLVQAQTLEAEGKELQAIATYLQAATVAADEPRILGALGMAYLRAGQLQSARLHLQKAVGLQPDYYRTRMGLGYLYLQLNRFIEADSELTKSVELLPVPENLYLLAETREGLGDNNKAITLYRRVFEADRRSKLGRAAASRLEEMEGDK